MIDLTAIISIAFLKKEVFCGSEKGMRFRLAKVSSEEEKDELEAVIWPEPWNYKETEEKEKERKRFPFTKQGIDQAVEWMNEKYNEKPEKWLHTRMFHRTQD